MKKIISAEQQWRDEMNVLINDGYVCDACCDGLGAIGENEFYAVYGNGKDLYFSKVGETYTMIDVTDVSEEFLLATNWEKLNPEDEWYDLKAVWKFLIDNENGKDVQSPIELCDLIWMGVYPDNNGMITQYEDKEVEVSTEEIEAIRKEIVERCKGHSIEEVRDMFQGYNWGEYGLDSFDFLYKGFVFCIQNTDNDKAEGEWFLSCIVYDECGNDSDSFKTTNLPIPPKEIKLDMSNIVDEKPEVKEKPKYDGEFLDHIASIWEDGRRTILVELSGEKYVINGLFDNEDVIIDVYIADNMQRIDRYFVVGAQEPQVDEAEWYCNYFVKKVVKDRNINECWYLSEKQFKFLKEA